MKISELIKCLEELKTKNGDSNPSICLQIMVGHEQFDSWKDSIVSGQGGNA